MSVIREDIERRGLKVEFPPPLKSRSLCPRCCQEGELALSGFCRACDSTVLGAEWVEHVRAMRAEREARWAVPGGKPLKMLDMW